MHSQAPSLSLSLSLSLSPCSPPLLGGGGAGGSSHFVVCKSNQDAYQSALMVTKITTLTNGSAPLYHMMTRATCVDCKQKIFVSVYSSAAHT